MLYCGYTHSLLGVRAHGMPGPNYGNTHQVCIPDVARALRFGLLPLPLIANGHSFFVQQLQRQSGVWRLAT
jgi:hypothetical protein